MRPVERGPHSTSTMLSPLRQTIAVALTLGAVLFAFVGLQTLIQTGPWLGLGIKLLIAVASCSLVIRLILGFVTRREPYLLLSLIPTAVASLLGLWLLAARFGSPTSSFDWLVTGQHFGHMRQLILSAQTLVAQNSAPITAYEPIALIGVAGAILVFLLADLLGNGVRIPALTGITILPLWLPSLMLVPDKNLGGTLGTCLCLLALIAVDNPFRPPSRPHNAGYDSFNSQPGQWIRLRVPRFSQTVTAVAIVTICSLLILWAVPSLPVWERISPPSVLGSSTDIKVSDTLDLSKSLQDRSNEVAFTYSTNGTDADFGPLRTTTLTDFDGELWSPSESDGRAEEKVTRSPLWPFDVSEGKSANELTITIDGFRDRTLPIPTEPRALIRGNASSYNSARDVLQLDEPTSTGDTFTFQTQERDFDPEQLRNPQDGPLLKLPSWYSELVLRPALAIPETSHIDEVRDLAEQVTDSSPTPYDSALALQEFLRDPEVFTYSLVLPEPRTDDSIWDFLTDRTGYCVQFASSMTIMARSLGLPARIGVGFLPGEKTGDNEFTVRGRNAHAWTEVFFDNVGWVRFDPTPAVQSGAAPQWAPDPADPVQEPTEAPTSATPTQAPSEEPAQPEPSEQTESAQDPSSGQSLASGDQRQHSGPNWLAWFAGLTGLLLAGALVLLYGRRRKDGLEAAWTLVLKRSSKLGIEVDESATLRQIADQLEPEARTHHERDGAISGEGPAHELARHLEYSRYAPTGSARDAVTAPDQTRIDQLVKTISDDLAVRFSGRRRVDDPSVPRTDA